MSGEYIDPTNGNIYTHQVGSSDICCKVSSARPRQSSFPLPGVSTPWRCIRYVDFTYLLMVDDSEQDACSIAASKELDKDEASLWEWLEVPGVERVARRVYEYPVGHFAREEWYRGVGFFAKVEGGKVEEIRRSLPGVYLPPFQPIVGCAQFDEYAHADEDLRPVAVAGKTGDRSYEYDEDNGKVWMRSTVIGRLQGQWAKALRAWLRDCFGRSLTHGSKLLGGAIEPADAEEMLLACEAAGWIVRGRAEPVALRRAAKSLCGISITAVDHVWTPNYANAEAMHCVMYGGFPNQETNSSVKEAAE